MIHFDLSALLQKQRHLTIDIVGDSVTQGTDCCTLNETYVAQYAKLLAKKYPEASVYRYDGIVDTALTPLASFSEPVEVQAGAGTLRIDIIKNGVGGNTVRRAINRIGDYTGVLANGKYADITVFMFGINDALKSDPSKYVLPEKFYEDYCELLQKFRKTETSEIVIMSATNSNHSLQEHVRETERLAQENHFLYVDQYAIWQRHYNPALPHFGQGDWLCQDPYHPTPLGAYQIAKALFDAMN